MHQHGQVQPLRASSIVVGCFFLYDSKFAGHRNITDGWRAQSIDRKTGEPELLTHVVCKLQCMMDRQLDRKFIGSGGILCIEEGRLSPEEMSGVGLSSREKRRQVDRHLRLARTPQASTPRSSLASTAVP